MLLLRSPTGYCYEEIVNLIYGPFNGDENRKAPLTHSLVLLLLHQRSHLLLSRSLPSCLPQDCARESETCRAAIRFGSSGLLVTDHTGAAFPVRTSAPTSISCSGFGKDDCGKELCCKCAWNGGCARHSDLPICFGILKSVVLADGVLVEPRETL